MRNPAFLNSLYYIITHYEKRKILYGGDRADSPGLSRQEEYRRIPQNIFMIEYDKFQNSLKRLREQYGNYRGTDNLHLDSITREAVAESVIHRFEICYECLWKVLRRYLVEELGVANAPNSPKPVFRLAFENNILPSPIEKWLDYANSRIDTSHDYDEGKARKCLGVISDFIDDAVDIYETMSGESWNR